jgi:hypothetical protein
MALKIINQANFKSNFGRTPITEPKITINDKSTIFFNMAVTRILQGFEDTHKIMFVYDDETNTYYIATGLDERAFDVKFKKKQGTCFFTNQAFITSLIENLKLPIGKKIGDTDEVVRRFKLDVSKERVSIGGFHGLHKIIWNEQ